MKTKDHNFLILLIELFKKKTKKNNANKREMRNKNTPLHTNRYIHYV